MDTNTILNNAILALHDELQALSQRRRESLRLHKGRLLGAFDRAHLYAFRAQPVGIVDGAPVTLQVGEYNRDARFDPASFVGSRGGEVIISSEDNLGLATEPLSLRYEPDRMVEELRKRLIETQNSNSENKFVLLDKLFAAPEPVDPPADGHKPMAALVDAAVAQPVTIAWTPRGTDEDGFITSCATRIAAEGGSALVLSPTTEQTDAHTLLLADSPAAKTVVRVGAPMPESLQKLKDLSPHNIARQRDPLAFEVLDRLTQQISELQDAGSWRKPNREIRLKLDQLEREKSRLEQFAWEAEQHVINSASIVLSPLGRAVTHPRVYGRRYDVVIVGNGQQALLAHIIWATMLAKKAVIFAGDPRQTPNWVRSWSDNALQWLRPNIFEASGALEIVNRGGWDSRLLMLQTQHTMHPQISQIINEISYGGRLLDAPEAAERTAAITNQPPEPGKAVVFLDVRYLHPHAQQGESRGSHSNVGTAAMALSVVESLLSQGVRSILLASLYRKQWQLHRALVHDAGLRDFVTTAPLDRCVGPQHDVVILDLVDTAPLLQAGTPLRGGWGSDFMRRLTAAFSSARCKLILIGDWILLQQLLPETAVLRRFLNDMLRGGAAIKPFPPGLLKLRVRPKNPSFYSDPGEAWQLIDQDIAAAAQRVIWNWPFANVYGVFNRSTFSRMFSVKARRALALAADAAPQQPLIGGGITVARSVRAEAGVYIDNNIFWLIGNRYSDGTTRHFVRISGRRAALQVSEAFGLDEIIPSVSSNPRPTR